MDRSDCGMAQQLGDDYYCSYYDFGYAKCSDVKNCPEALDEDDDDIVDQWDRDAGDNAWCHDPDMGSQS